MKYLAPLVGILLIAGSIWVWNSAPCGLWKYGSAGEMPARCLHADW